jgi:hypothetical protein
LLALLFVTPAPADTLDCAVIKSTAHPFGLTLGGGITERLNERFDFTIYF